MHFLTNAVNGVLAVTSLFDHFTRRLIDFPSLQLSVGGERIWDTVDCSIASLGDNLEDFLIPVRDRIIDIPDSRQIAVDRLRPV